MKAINFSIRNFKELVRDPLSIIFAIILPLFLLFIFQQFKIPNEVFSIENFTPGIIVFGFSFITLFTATLVSKDRDTSLLTRLCASPMKISDYIFGYVLSILPIILLQNVLFFATALLLGLNFSVNILFTILVSLLVSVLFIMFGILIGCVTTSNSASGVSSIIVQLVAFTSGMYFSTSMVGNTFSFVCKVLPFSHSLEIVKNVLNGNTNDLLLPIVIVSLYTVIVAILSILLFNGKMKNV